MLPFSDICLVLDPDRGHSGTSARAEGLSLVHPGSLPLPLFCTYVCKLLEALYYYTCLQYMNFARILSSRYKNPLVVQIRI
jgi:hypothetical protein